MHLSFHLTAIQLVPNGNQVIKSASPHTQPAHIPMSFSCFLLIATSLESPYLKGYSVKFGNPLCSQL